MKEDHRWKLIAFKYPKLQTELREKTHPDIREMFLAFAEASRKTLKLPPPIVTCLSRTELENRNVNGVPNSRHLYDCAGDLSIRVYHEHDLPVALVWLRGYMAEHGGKAKWGLLVHDVGSGRHIHVERRDESWRLTYAAAKEKDRGPVGTEGD